MCSSEGPPPGAGPKRLKSRPRMANTMVKTMLADKTPRHVPPGFNPVTLYLTVDDPDRLVAFAKAAFGAEELKDQRATGPDGKTMHTAFRVETCIIETGRASVSGRPLRQVSTSMSVTQTRPTPVRSRPEELASTTCGTWSTGNVPERCETPAATIGTLQRTPGRPRSSRDRPPRKVPTATCTLPVRKRRSLRIGRSVVSTRR